MTRPLDSADEFLRGHRLSEAAAYRRLADAALRAAEILADPDTTPVDEQRAQAAVTGRIESVKHARVLLAACRTGMARAAEHAASAREQKVRHA